MLPATYAVLLGKHDDGAQSDKDAVSGFVAADCFAQQAPLKTWERHKVPYQDCKVPLTTTTLSNTNNRLPVLN